MTDNINNPPHYTHGKIQPADIMDDWDLGRYEALVIKYIARAKHKGNELEDLKKAQWYLNRRIKALEGVTGQSKGDNTEEWFEHYKERYARQLSIPKTQGAPEEKPSLRVCDPPGHESQIRSQAGLNPKTHAGANFWRERDAELWGTLPPLEQKDIESGRYYLWMDSHGNIKRVMVLDKYKKYGVFVCSHDNSSLCFAVDASSLRECIL